MPIPAQVEFIAASLLTDTLGTPLNAVEHARVAGAPVAIFGCGPLGLMMIQVAKALGAAKVIVEEPLFFRQMKAKELGADFVIDPTKGNPVEQIRELLNDVGIEVAINAVPYNNAEAAQQAMDCVVPGGRFCSITSSPKTINDNREVFISWYFKRSDYPKMLTLVDEDKVKLAPLVTHTYPLEQLAEAFKMRFQQQAESLKVVVVMDSS